MKKQVVLPTAYKVWAMAEADMYCKDNGFKKGGKEWEACFTTLIKEAFTHSLTPGEELNPHLKNNPSPKKMGQAPLDTFELTRKGGIIEKVRINLQRKNWLITFRIMSTFFSNVYMSKHFPSLNTTLRKAKDMYMNKRGKNTSHERTLILQGKYIEIFTQAIFAKMFEEMVQMDFKKQAEQAVVAFFDSYWKANPTKDKDQIIRELLRQEAKDIFAIKIYDSFKDEDIEVKYKGKAPDSYEIVPVAQ